MNPRVKRTRQPRWWMALALLAGASWAPGQSRNQSDGPAPAQAARPAPQMKVDATVFDFARVHAGAIVRHDFVVENTGTADLVITSVNPSCGCTTAAEWDRRIAPGKRGIIPLQLNTTNFSGEISKHIEVVSNDPARPSISLEMKGTVWKPVEVQPTTAVLSVTEETATPVTRTVRITSNLERPLTVSEPRCSSDVFTAELATIREGSEYEVRVTARPPFKPGPANAPITLKTSSSEVPELTILAQLLVQPAVMAFPDRISVPESALASPLTPAVTIRNNGAPDFEIGGATVNVPGATARVQALQPNRLFRISVTLPAGFEAKRQSDAAVSITTNNPKHPTLLVPIVALAPRVVPAAGGNSELRVVPLTGSARESSK